MRYLTYAFLAAIGVILISVSLANRTAVQLNLVPDGLVDILGFQASAKLPLFVVVLGSIMVGILIGYAFEWLREAKHRRDAGRGKREVRRLEREVVKLKDQRDQGKDEVLAILDEAS
ncbi:MAG: LapA family protein [Rhodobacteraceae bacterium]|nr:LapA family protein [Paracoccaceae bacterium]